MNGWYIAGAVLLLLFLLGQLKVGGEADYDGAVLTVRLRLGPVRLTVLPRRPKEKSPEKQEKKPVSPQKSQEKPKKTWSFDELKDLAERLVPLALEAVGSLYEKLVVDVLHLSITVGSQDPADTAMLYGRVHALLGAVWEPLTRALHVRNGRGHVAVDFDSPCITLTGRAALSLKLGQALRLCLWFGLRALKQFLQFRKARKAV